MKKILKKVTKNLGNINTGKTTIDNKLTLAQMNVTWALEYGINLKERVITWSQDIDFPMFDIFDTALTIMEAESKRAITIRLNSPGGSTYEAMAVIGRIQKSACFNNIIVEGYGHVMSAATLILACAKKRKIHRWAQFMWHEAAYNVSGQHSNIKAWVKQMEREEQQWAEAMAEVTGKTKKFWLDNGVHIDYFLTAQKLLEFGVVDEVF